MPVNDTSRDSSAGSWQSSDHTYRDRYGVRVQTVAVAGASPTWCRGMKAILEDAGYDAAVLDDLGNWKPGPGGAGVVVDVGDPAASEAVRGFAEDHPHIPVIAVVDGLSLTGFAHWIRLGATVVVDSSDDAELIMGVIESTLDGRPRVPGQYLRAMAQLVPADDDLSSWLNDEQVTWLQRMAAGATVAEIADDIGYSERAMFRSLKSLYVRLGVRNRTDALLWASRRGILGP